MRRRSTHARISGASIIYHSHTHTNTQRPAETARLASAARTPDTNSKHIHKKPHRTRRHRSIMRDLRALLAVKLGKHIMSEQCVRDCVNMPELCAHPILIKSGPNTFKLRRRGSLKCSAFSGLPASRHNGPERQAMCQASNRWLFDCVASRLATLRYRKNASACKHLGRIPSPVVLLRPATRRDCVLKSHLG